MALAGYDPRAASKIWERAHQKFGSAPGNYTYDHSLNIDRLHKVASITPIALKYFAGQDTVNPNAAQILGKNDLIQRMANGNNESDLQATLEVVLGVAADNLNTKNEERARLNPAQISLNPFVKISSLQIGRLSNGSQGIFGQLRNIGQTRVTQAQIRITYYNALNQVIQTQMMTLNQISVPFGGVINWSGQLQNAFGYTRVGADAVGASQ